MQTVRALLSRAAITTAAAALAVAVIVPGARADVTGSSGDNVQGGNNRAISHQSGTAESGDAIAGGQVVGVVAAAGGSATVDVSNSATNASATSGDVRGSNDMGVLVGLNSVLGRQVVRGISSRVGAGSEQSLITADDLIGPDGPVGPGSVAPTFGDGVAINPSSDPTGPPGPVGPAMNGLGSAGDVSPAVPDVQPTGPPGPVGPAPAG